MEYKSVSKYLDKKSKNSSSYHKLIYKVLIIVIILLSLLIFLKYDKNNKQIVTKYLADNNLNVAALNKWYKSHFGDITPFQDFVKDNTKLVFGDTLEYQGISAYEDGAKLEVKEKYLVPVLESGIVVFAGDKEKYGKTIIIEQTNGIHVWYGNLENLNLNIYDYASKKEIVGEVKDKTLYLAFEKDGEFLNYENYIK